MDRRTGPDPFLSFSVRLTQYKVINPVAGIKRLEGKEMQAMKKTGRYLIRRDVRVGYQETRIKSISIDRNLESLFRWLLPAEKSLSLTS